MGAGATSPGAPEPVDSIGVDAGDRMPRADISPCRLEKNTTVTADNARHLATEQYLAAGLLDVTCIGGRNEPEVDDARRRAMKRADACSVRFELAQPLRADQLEARDTVGETTAMELLPPRQLAWLGRDDDLATALRRDAPFLAVAVELGSAP